jgi:hypothetical protein
MLGLVLLFGSFPSLVSYVAKRPLKVSGEWSDQALIVSLLLVPREQPT